MHLTSIIYVGKESNRLEEVEHGLIHDWDEVQARYVDPRQDPWRRDVFPILKRIPRAALARVADVSERYIQALRNGHRRPSPAIRVTLTRAAADYARTQLPEPVADDLAACAAYGLLTSRRR